MKTTLTYVAALASALCWLAVLKAACLCDRETRTALARGERMDRVDDAFARLDAIHNSIFGSDE